MNKGVEIWQQTGRAGDFDPDRTFSQLEGLLDSETRPLRLVGVIDEENAPNLDPDAWARFEHAADDLLTDRATVLCVYDARACSEHLLGTATCHRLIQGNSRLHVTDTA